MFHKILQNFQNENGTPSAYQILDQSCVLLLRINEDKDVSIPKVSSLLQKHHASFRDYLFSIFESNLLICKKIGEYKEQGFEITADFEQKLNSATTLLFSIMPLLTYEQNCEIGEFIVNFYAPVPAQASTL